MRWLIICIVVCCLTGKGWGEQDAENCRVCHSLTVKGIHATVACSSCHGAEVQIVANPAGREGGAARCTTCHRGYGELFGHAMATRERERAFVKRVFEQQDPGFFVAACSSCHISGCLDCHGGSGHAIRPPGDNDCLQCHNGYFVGADYHGMAPREDHVRYQRGRKVGGAPYLKMLPDVHAEAGMGCRDCHTMQSLAQGKRVAKRCVDCHVPSRKVLEHRIGNHLRNLECSACHAAWAAQEYGTFWLSFTDSQVRSDFPLNTAHGEYLRSAYLRKQDAPPLGIDRAGLVAPIRPQFIVAYSRIVGNKPQGTENRLLAAEWKAYTPHTIQRGTVMCEGCHDNPRRFLLERREERIYCLDQDLLPLGSFWDSTGQRLVNGTFMPAKRYEALAARSPAYLKGYVEKWKRLVNRVGASSAR